MAITRYARIALILLIVFPVLGMIVFPIIDDSNESLGQRVLSDVFFGGFAGLLADAALVLLFVLAILVGREFREEMAILHTQRSSQHLKPACAREMFSAAMRIMLAPLLAAVVAVLGGTLLGLLSSNATNWRSGLVVSNAFMRVGGGILSVVFAIMACMVLTWPLWKPADTAFYLIRNRNLRATHGWYRIER